MAEAKQDPPSAKELEEKLTAQDEHIKMLENTLQAHLNNLAAVRFSSMEDLSRNIFLFKLGEPNTPVLLPEPSIPWPALLALKQRLDKLHG